MTFSKVRALIFVAVLFVTAGIVVIMAIGRDTQTKASHNAACAPGEVPAHNDMPEKNQVKINVFNGTSRVDLAADIGGQFKNRGFVVGKMETAPPKADGKPYDNIATIVYGPDAVGAAYEVSAYFLANQATMQFNIKRKGSEVDVILGTAFQQLATSTEVNQSIAIIGRPPLEPGTCEA
jgi:LytR cell envelope-related transcriptional attenuator